MIPTCKKLYLCNQSLDPLCVINGLRTETVDLHIRIKDYSTLSFEVDKYINIDGELVLSNGYDELNVYMYIYLEDVGYFKMQHPSIINDGNNEIKIINANSIEQEFEDKDWINFKCNTGEADSLEQLATDNLNDLGFAKEFVKFYNPKNKELSLLHIILTKMPGWTINDDDIDHLLWNTKLSLNESNINLYALLTSRIAPKADCIFVFNILNRTIKAIHKNNLD